MAMLYPNMCYNDMCYKMGSRMEEVFLNHLILNQDK